jgi:hypothetical protein
MMPNITMDEVVSRVPFLIDVHGGILAEDCTNQIKKLAKR